MKKIKWIRARITEAQFKELKIKLAHEGLTFQQLLENAILEYLKNKKEN